MDGYLHAAKNRYVCREIFVLLYFHKITLLWIFDSLKVFPALAVLTRIPTGSYLYFIAIGNEGQV